MWENIGEMREILVFEANKKWIQAAWIEKLEHTMIAFQNVIMIWL